MEGKQHGDVVSAIKAGGDETKLLVVDKETDEFFKKCKVIPSQEHLTGELIGEAEAPTSRVLARVLDLTVSQVRDGQLPASVHPHVLLGRPRGVGWDR